MGNPNPNRDFYDHGSGTEVTAEGGVFDVPAWREKHIPGLHYRVHEGQAFSTHNNATALADGETINIHIYTGAISPHITMDVHGKFDFDFELLEAPTVAGGTPSEAYNKNRVSANTSALTLTNDVTVVADGLIINSDSISDGQRIGGHLQVDSEWILKASTDYVFRFTSRANSNRAHINLTWYEPT